MSRNQLLTIPDVVGPHVCEDQRNAITKALQPWAQVLGSPEATYVTFGQNKTCRLGLSLQSFEFKERNLLRGFLLWWLLAFNLASLQIHERG